MTKAEKEKQAIERIMAGLKCTKAEALEIYAYDKAVDQDESQKLAHDLSGDKKKIASKFSHTGTRERKVPTAYKFQPRQRKPNVVKADIVKALSQCLETLGVENLRIENPERLLKFDMGGMSFDLTLVKKNKK